jgi:hypothetical protein
MTIVSFHVLSEAVSSKFKISTRSEVYDILCLSVLPEHYVTSSVLVMVRNFVEVICSMAWEVFFYCVTIGVCELIDCLLNSMANYIYVYTQ